MMVDIPVEAIDKRCINCPELEIDVNTTTLYDNGSAVYYGNKISCKHVSRCQLLLSYKSNTESTHEEQASK